MSKKLSISSSFKCLWAERSIELNESKNESLNCGREQVKDVQTAWKLWSFFSCRPFVALRTLQPLHNMASWFLLKVLSQEEHLGFAVGQYLKSISTCIHVWSIWFELSWFWTGFESSFAWRPFSLTTRCSSLNSSMSNELLLVNAFCHWFSIRRRYKMKI